MSDTSFGSGLSVGGANGPRDSADVPLDPRASAPLSLAPPAAPEAPTSSPGGGGIFGSGMNFGGPRYTPPDPNASPLDQTADLLSQRVKRANEIAANPLAQFFDPEAAQAARDFVPKATEALQTIKKQKADMAANRQQAETLGLHPGEVADEASQANRVEVAKARALKGDLKVFKGLQAVDPLSAAAIQDQVFEVVGGHLTKAQFAFDKLSNMRNQGEYVAAVNSLRKDGTLTDLEALGLKVPDSFENFNAAKAREGQALREARIGADTARAKLEERNTYAPMEEKEAKTYNGRMTTIFGDQITNGTWSRNASSNARGLVVNGAADPRDLGKSFTLATPEQRKAIEEESDKLIDKQEREKYRAFNRTYQLATKDAKGNAIPAEGVTDAKGNKTFLNTNPNVQQGVAEGLASMLRGGSGGANVGLLKIELAKRGWAQGAIDGLVSNYAGAVNTLFADANRTDKPYLSQATQKQIRDVMDVLKTYNDQSVGDRAVKVAERAGALGLDAASIGYGDKESAGAIGDAIERGRRAQIERMMPNHQAIGGGDGVFQLGAQRPGSGATTLPPGTAPTTQIPGAQPLQTPVQQTQNPQAPGPGGPGAPPPAQPSAPSPVPNGGTAPPAPPVSPGPTGGAPITIAGQSVPTPPLPPGASPNYLLATQRIESGNEKDPWTAGNDKSSAKGAFQFIKSTWAANKPAGAPDDPRKATPQQQTEAVANLTAKNAAALTNYKLPVTDTNLYVLHNLGSGAGPALLTASPTADARAVVGEAAAKNNPMFFKGRPTVATVLQRYNDAMNTPPDDGPKPRPNTGGATATASQEQEPPSLMRRISRMLSQGIAGGDEAKDKAVADAGSTAVEHAPAILSTLGAVGGSLAGPGGTMTGGSVGGAGGQMLKDWIKGNPQSPTDIAREGALGAVFGIAPAGRPVVGAAARTLGAGGVEAATEAAKGGDAEDITTAGAKGAGLAAGGELFGRALGMVGHKVFSMFAPDAQKAVQAAAKKFAEADEILKTEPNRLPGTGTTGGGPNPKYVAAEQARGEAETVLKDAGLKPEEAAYAHKVSSEGVPKQEAEAAKPGALEKERVGAGYRQLENEVAATGKGAPKASPKLPDGPLAAVENKKVSAEHKELAERTEMAITAPAKSWQEKWVQLKDARSALLDAERDALTSTAPGRTQTAKDMRALADTVRTQQEKAAKYVFGEKDGAAFMERLKTLDVRYRRVLEATNNGDLASAALLKGEAGRDADRKFRAFAHDDPTALAAWDAMRASRSNVEKDVRTLVGAEKIPYLGKVISAAKMLGSFKEWMQDRVAGSPAKFEDFVKLYDDSGKRIRDAVGTASQRGAVM